MPQVDITTYTTTIFSFSHLFLLGYVLLNIFILVPLINAYKVEKKSKLLVNVRTLKAKNYLNLFNLFLVGISLD